MRSTMTTSNRRVSVIAAMLAIVIVSGCSMPSLLITPVSSKRTLVETELSRDSTFAADKIAIIDVSGTIQNAAAGSFLGTDGEHPVSLLLEQLDQAQRDPKVKAVILRVNSPGGTVVASELMHDEIMHFKKSGKPVIAVMMDVAASGGYYIACAADEIVAQPSTVTGSIGVIMLLVDVTGTMNLIGVKTDAIVSGVHKDTGSPFRAMRIEERELFQAVIADMYDRFVKVVVAGRPKLDDAKVRALADGRIYTANQALEVGLIDKIATLRDTVVSVKDRVGIKNARVVAYHRAYDYRPNYYAKAPSPTRANVSLLSLEFLAGALPQTPQFLYLWSPGLSAIGE